MQPTSVYVSSAVLVLVLVSSAGALLSCNSYLQLFYPELFTHCEACSLYTEWSEWENGAVISVSISVCESEKAIQQSRSRYPLQTGCPPQTETQQICMPTRAERLIIALNLGGIQDVVILPIEPHGPQVETEEQGKIKGRAIIPADLNIARALWITSQQQECIYNKIYNESAVCTRPLSKRSIQEPLQEDNTPNVQSHPNSQGEHHHSTNKKSHSISADPLEAPIPFDWNEHHMRFRRNDYGARDCSMYRYYLFILDTSGSIGSGDFKKMKTTVSKMTRFFCNDSITALMTFGRNIHVDFCFDCFSHRQGLAALAINHTHYRDGEETRTGTAAQCACDVVLTPQCGLPSDASCIDVIFITDGHSNGGGRSVCQAVQCMHDYVIPGTNKKAIRTRAIGIGDYSADQLKCIVNHPDLEVFEYENFDAFQQDIDEIEMMMLTEDKSQCL